MAAFNRGEMVGDNRSPATAGTGVPAAPGADQFQAGGGMGAAAPGSPGRSTGGGGLKTGATRELPPDGFEPWQQGGGVRTGGLEPLPGAQPYGPPQVQPANPNGSLGGTQLNQGLGTGNSSLPPGVAGTYGGTGSLGGAQVGDAPDTRGMYAYGPGGQIIPTGPTGPAGPGLGAGGPNTGGPNTGGPNTGGGDTTGQENTRRTGGVDQPPPTTQPPPTPPGQTGGGTVSNPPPAPGTAPGVNSGDPTQPGYSYGVGGTNLGIQGSVAPGQTNTGAITAAQMPNTSIKQGADYYQRGQDAFYNQGKSRLDPQMEAEQARLETQLENMGHTRGSSGWQAEMDKFNQKKTDAYSTLMNQAITNSGSEAARMQGMDISAGQFGNQATQQNFQNQLMSKEDQNKAYAQEFQQNMDSGKFANAAQAQEAAQKTVDAQVRNSAMSAQGSLAEQAASREQQASQFSQSYELQTRAQQAQMDQFAESMGMTGRQLDAQIGQWAEQNGISRENMVNQLLMAREQNATQRYTAGQSASAARAGASASRDSARYSADASIAANQAANDLANRRFAYETQRQSQFDPVLLRNLTTGGGTTAP